MGLIHPEITFVEMVAKAGRGGEVSSPAGDEGLIQHLGAATGSDECGARPDPITCALGLWRDGWHAIGLIPFPFPCRGSCRWLTEFHFRSYSQEWYRISFGLWPLDVIAFCASPY